MRLHGTLPLEVLYALRRDGVELVRAAILIRERFRLTAAQTLDVVRCEAELTPAEEAALETALFPA